MWHYFIAFRHYIQYIGKAASPSSSIDKATLPSFTTLFDSFDYFF